MTVKELKEALDNYSDDIDVMTKKTEILGNVGEVNSIRQDSYGFFGADIPCILLTDEYARKELKALPPVNPQAKTGHWIEHERNGIAHIECSECSSWFLRSHLVRNSYCPNCGTKMQEVEE